MARTDSMMMPLGTPAPDFTLPDTVSGRSLSLADVAGEKATLVMFICNHCPYVIHVNDELIRLAHDYQPQGVGFVAISSNDVDNYPDDAPDRMTEVARQLGYPFPYLYDETQEVAKAYDAVCTPDFFLFDGDLKCAYRGQLDKSRPKNGEPVTGADMRAALDAVIAGEIIPDDVQVPSQGCNIKWKAA
ncbi:thioredoxin family protein [Salinisphaera sp. P385]|uniref:Thioredoxin family protein n=1 Tax=Spectribacter acetivorans TaxID=3075603 RepID=A0ABU3B9X0_9GAMM|nr:thioredoxin family protein [Salinisphaera sp. P385]MDT0618058.1 thioredoxin family protein [Salinisphaera sp. P385]